MLIGQKMNTKSYSSAVQESSLKSDTKLKNVGATANNPYGDKAIGEIANELVDPNYIDPKKVVRDRKTDLDKDAFFKLMLTQMKNQDPTNPMQSHEMAAHLAQFTSLEQMSNINANIEALRKSQEPNTGFEALNFIGKSISADSSKVFRNASDKSHDLRFRMMKDATEVKIHIRDTAGNPIRTLNAGQRTKGEAVVSWNGITDQGLKAREGDYVVSIEAKDGEGKKVGVETNVAGKITGVNFTAKGPVLMIGDQTVFLSDVKKIEDLNLKEELQSKDGKAPQTAAPAAATEALEPKEAPSINKGVLSAASKVGGNP